MTDPFDPRAAGGEIVLFDLEFTAWEGSMDRGWSEDWEFREIIQIGAVRVKDNATFSEIDRMICYVTPTRNPVLSDYIKDLTGIDQETLDAEGFDFSEALAVFLNFCNDARMVLCYDGDPDVLKENVILNGLKKPEWPEFGALAPSLGNRLGHEFAKSTSYGMQKLVGIDASGREHDAMDDSLAMVAALRVLRADGKI